MTWQRLLLPPWRNCSVWVVPWFSISSGVTHGNLNLLFRPARVLVSVVSQLAAVSLRVGRGCPWPALAVFPSAFLLISSFPPSLFFQSPLPLLHLLFSPMMRPVVFFFKKLNKASWGCFFFLCNLFLKGGRSLLGLLARIKWKICLMSFQKCVCIVYCVWLGVTSKQDVAFLFFIWDQALL